MYYLTTQPHQPPPYYTGQNIGIAFLDTGISPVVDFLTPKNRIAVFRDLIGKKKSPYDDNGHGTHVTCLNKGGTPSQGKECLRVY